MKRILQCILAIAVLMIVCTGCSKSPDEEQLAELLPNEIFEYYLDDELYTSDLGEIKIVREDLNDDVDTAFVEVDLKDGIFDRTIYLCLTSRYYKNGGWNLESWYAYDYESIISWNADFQRKLLEEEIERFGIHSYTEISFSSEGATAYADYEFDDTFPNLTLNGTLGAKIDLKCEAFEQYPICYSTVVRLDTSQLEAEWNIAGTWSGEPVTWIGSKQPYRLTLKKVTGGVEYDGYYIYEDIYDEKNSEHGDGKLKFNEIDLTYINSIDSLILELYMNFGKYGQPTQLKFTPAEAFIAVGWGSDDFAEFVRE